MTSIHRSIRLAAAFAVAFLASGAAAASTTSAGPMSASVPPPVPTPESTVEEGELPEVVESWSLAPAGSLDGDQAGNRPDLSYLAAPGTVIDDAVIVYNFGNVPMNFRIYATDAFNNDEGQFDLLPGDQPPVDAGSWVTVAQENISLLPGKQATIPITVRVPLDAAPGDHAGAVVASSVSVSDNGDGQVVNVDRRTGTRLYIQVSGELTPELALAGVQSDYRQALNPFGGSAEVTFRVENRGNMRLGGTPTISIAGPFGLGERTLVLDELVELLPGEDVTVTATVDDVPALLLESVKVSVEPPAAAKAAGAATVVGTDRMFAPPVALLLVLLAGLFGMLAWRAYRRHRGDAALHGDQSGGEPIERDREPQPV